jgi:ABC-type multidrug transport system ATPase subunit
MIVDIQYSGKNNAQKNILQWLNLSITTKNDERVILDNLTGEAKSGESLAIMGSSGAGKTTFLNYLSQKSASKGAGLKKTSGDIKFIVNEVDETNSFTALSSYVTQDDILFEVLTPKELLTFAARMRLPQKTSKEREEIILNLIQRLGLEKCADTKVGSVMQ